MSEPEAIYSSTGIGSMPGTDPLQATRDVLDAGLSLPFMPELPARGWAAQMIARASAQLVDLPVERVASGWALSSRPGTDLRQARDLWQRDVDALQIAASGYEGPLKVAITGPWTLAAMLELPNGHRVLTDPGALRDLHGSLHEGLVQLVEDLRRRLPGASLILQLDEPMLGAALHGTLRGPSGLEAVAAVDPQIVEDRYVALGNAVGARLALHSCAAAVPYAVLARCGFEAVLIDAALLTRAELDPLGELLDAGTTVVLGVIDTAKRPTPPSIDAAAATVQRVAQRIGIPDEQILTYFGISPACGLAGSTPAVAAEQLAAVREIARRLQ